MNPFRKIVVSEPEVTTLRDVHARLPSYQLASLKAGDTLAWTLDLYDGDTPKERVRFVVEVT